jgi:O-acetyl-ADP-ribose deacetylase (regulator of RNase III)
LKQAYRNSLKLAVSNGLKVVAFPSISTGAYGYPVKEASVVALRTIKAFLENEDKLERVLMVLFSSRDFDVYLQSAKALFGQG